MTEPINSCEGCYTYRIRTEHKLIPECTATSNDMISKCPCIECIIKVICSNECQGFRDFRDYIRLRRRR